MMKREQIFLSKNFTVIESDIPFTLKFNVKDNTANSAEDIINFKSGWYIFDNNKLLPQYVDGVYNLPKYNCWIEYDETLGTVSPHWYTCYINPKSVESLSAESTELDPSQLAILRQDIQINGAKVDSFAVATHSDLGAVKSSVDALQASNHSDLGSVKTSVDTVKSSVEECMVVLDGGIAGAVSSKFDFYIYHWYRAFSLNHDSESPFWGDHRIATSKDFYCYLHFYSLTTTHGDYWIDVPLGSVLLLNCSRNVSNNECIVVLQIGNDLKSITSTNSICLDVLRVDGDAIEFSKI